ncbi:hypothetical protein FF2_025276 [Malus domestica]
MQQPAKSFLYELNSKEYIKTIPSSGSSLFQKGQCNFYLLVLACQQSGRNCTGNNFTSLISNVNNLSRNHGENTACNSIPSATKEKRRSVRLCCFGERSNQSPVCQAQSENLNFQLVMVFRRLLGV